MNSLQLFITIASIALTTYFIRFIPFFIFSSKRGVPPFVKYLGDSLPFAIFGILIVYCLKDTSFISGTYGIPEMIAILVTIVIHLWKKQTLLTLTVATVLYMVMVQLV